MGGRRGLRLTPANAKNSGPDRRPHSADPGVRSAPRASGWLASVPRSRSRDLKGLHDFERGKQEWASQMASLLTGARDAAAAARQAGQSSLDAAVLDDLLTRYRALAAAGLAANLYRRTATGAGRPPHRPPVPQLRGPDPPLRHPP